MSAAAEDYQARSYPLGLAEDLVHRPTFFEVALWLGDGGLMVEYGGDTLSRYETSP